MTLKELIYLEQNLLEIKEKHENKEVLFKTFQDVVNFNQELENIGKITSLYFNEMKILDNLCQTEQDLITWNNKLLMSNINYDEKNANYFLKKENLLYLD